VDVAQQYFALESLANGTWHSGKKRRRGYVGIPRCSCHGYTHHQAFTKWINGQLGEGRINDIISDLQDGTALIELAHKLFPDIPLPRYSKNPKMR
jgi:hypothetical protein